MLCCAQQHICNCRQLVCVVVEGILLYVGRFRQFEGVPIFLASLKIRNSHPLVIRIIQVLRVQKLGVMTKTLIDYANAVLLLIVLRIVEHTRQRNA